MIYWLTFLNICCIISVFTLGYLIGYDRGIKRIDAERLKRTKAAIEIVEKEIRAKQKL